MNNNPLLARFEGVPAYLASERRALFESCLSAVVTHERAAEMLSESAQADDGFWPAPDDWRAALRPYVVRDGILQIPVKGVLLHDFAFAVGRWATGYIYIWRAFLRGMTDPTVRGIALMCDSPGGQAAGCFDLVEKMVAFRGTKPIRAFAHEGAYSAAYAVATVADKIVVSRTGGVGSIGVVVTHLDVSGAMEQAGLKVTFVFAGKHKVDGNAYEPLPDDVRERLQAHVDESYAVFVKAVAQNRSLSEGAVRRTEALCFTATEAKSEGLADEIGSLDDAVAAFAVDLSTEDEGDHEMSTTSAASGPAATALAEMQARHDLELTTKVAEAERDGKQAGATAMQARCKAILNSDEAKGRESQAHHLALETSLSAEEAIGLLKNSPKATGGNRFDAAMQAAGNPGIGPDAEGDETAEGAALGAQIVTAYLGFQNPQQQRSA
jgi:signal peptide peptidase SppA